MLEKLFARGEKRKYSTSDGKLYSAEQLVECFRLALKWSDNEWSRNPRRQHER